MTHITNLVTGLTPSQIKTVYNQGGAIRFGPVTGSP